MGDTDDERGQLALSPEDARIEMLLAEAREGCKLAVAELVEMIRAELREVFRAHRSGDIRTNYDSDDFLQDIQLRLVSRPIAKDVFRSWTTFHSYMMHVAKRRTTT